MNIYIYKSINGKTVDQHEFDGVSTISIEEGSSDIKFGCVKGISEETISNAGKMFTNASHKNGASYFHADRVSEFVLSNYLEGGAKIVIHKAEDAPKLPVIHKLSYEVINPHDIPNAVEVHMVVSGDLLSFCSESDLVVSVFLEGVSCRFQSVNSNTINLYDKIFS